MARWHDRTGHVQGRALGWAGYHCPQSLVIPDLADQCVRVLLGTLRFRDAVELDAQRFGIRLRVEISWAQTIAVET